MPCKPIRETDRVIGNLKSDTVLREFVDFSLPIPGVYVGAEQIGLIILGQDPTVENKSTKRQITCALNMNKSSSLSHYVRKICRDIHIGDDEIYVTNMVKNFFIETPKQLKESAGIDVVDLARDYWFETLEAEIAQFPLNVPVMTLGEPVLRSLCGTDKTLREYWGYKEEWENKGFGKLSLKRRKYLLIEE